MNFNLTKIFYLLIVLFIILILSRNIEESHYLSWVGIFFFTNLIYDFYNGLGKVIPIRSLMLLIAFLQWIIAPFLSYHLYADSQFYYMQIPEEQYMSFNVPAILALYFGLMVNFSSSKVNYDELYYTSENDPILKKRGYFLYFTGLFSLFLIPFMPAGLSFAFFLLSKLHFIGAFYLFASNIRNKYLWLMSALVPVIINAGTSTIFHDLLLWGGFIFIIYAFFNKIGNLHKLIIFAAGVLLIMFIQFIKSEYRGQLREAPVAAQEENTGAELMLDVADKKFAEEGLSDEYFQGLVDRLNQGWIIARIMYVVPDFEPYANGETIKEGILGALVPRFLNPDKVRSGGANFERFTGMVLIGTSMNIGLIGEAYANYGERGGIFFMFIIGLFFNLTLSVLRRYAKNTYEVFLWIPFLFLYVVKAEDDFATMINQFTKAVMVCYFIFWIMKKIYPRKNIYIEKIQS